MLIEKEKDETIGRWAYNAEALQQELYCLLGDRTFEEYNTDSYDALELKIAFTKFGISENAQSALSYDEYQEKNHFADETSNLFKVYTSLYSEQQRKVAKETLNLIIDLAKQGNPNFSTLKISFIFIVFQVGNTENCGQIPIIRILRKESADPLNRTSMDETWYIDHENRVYNNWAMFLEKNRLPKMRICYPKNGYYSVDAFGYSPYVPDFDVEIEFGMTPATKTSNAVFNFLDYTSTGVMLSTLGLTIAAALSAPISAPVLTTMTVSGGIAALYGAGRSTATLFDRKLHFQPITLTDPESRMCWLAIGGAGFAFSASIGSMLLRRATAAGNVVGSTARYTVNGLNASSLVINGANVVNQSYHVGEKLLKGQGITAFDVLNLTMSIFFFGNSLISFKTANRIIQEVQNDVITNTTNQLDTKKSKAGFERLMKDTEGETHVEKNARVIRTLNLIENPKDFFTRTFKLTKEVNKAKGTIGFGEKGGFAINGAEVAPDQILKLPPSQQQVFLNNPASNSVAPSVEPPLAIPEEAAVSMLGEKTGLGSTAQENAIAGENVPLKINEILSDVKFTEIIKNLTRGLDGAKLLETQVWNAFNEIQNKQRVPELLQIAANISHILGIKVIEDFLTVCTYICIYVTRHVWPIAKVFLKQRSEAENQVIDELKDENSAARTEVTDALLVEFFRRAHGKNKFNFESPESAYSSYDLYKKQILSFGSIPITPTAFMETVQWLFTETEWKKRVITEDKLYFRIEHESEDIEWKGTLYEKVDVVYEKDNLKEVFVKSFEYVKKGQVKKSNSFFGRLFS